MDKKLKDYLIEGNKLVISEYLKSLSPSAIELELMSLAAFEFNLNGEDNQNKFVRDRVVFIL
jgi:hypothetical protein